MRSNRSRQITTLTPAFDAHGDPVEQAIEALRVEWRSGFNGQQITRIVLPAVQSLARLAATGQAQEEIGRILYRLDQYPTLTSDQRKTELADLAASLGALKPHLRLAASNGEQFGKLNSAVAPGRPGASQPQAQSAADIPAARPVRAVPPDADGSAGHGTADRR